MGHPDFRVHNRIFASLHDADQFGMVKLTPEQQSRLVREAPRSFSPEAGAWGRSGYTRVLLKSADVELVGEAMTLAWQNVTKVSAKPRAAAGSRKRPRKA
jgi:hypothetical protein